MITMRHRINLLNTWIDKVDLEDVGRRIDAFIRTGTPHQVVPANLDFLRLCDQDPSFQDVVNKADLVVPDGMPLVWAAKQLGEPLPRRIAGMDLIHECARLAAEQGYRIYLLGAESGVAVKAAEVLRERYPGLKIDGRHAPTRLPLSPEDEKVTLSLIRAYQPDILFVAFGAPLQEQWIQKHLDTLGVPVCAGVGGAFDMLAGRVSRAPEWMQGRGLEWVYRLMLEPQRLWKRYFVHDLPVFARLMASCTVGNSVSRSSTVLERLVVEATQPSDHMSPIPFTMEAVPEAVSLVG